MKKWMVAGAAVLLMAGTGTTALAASTNLLPGRTISPVVAWKHHMGHSLGHRGVWDGVSAGSFCDAGCTAGTTAVHHAENVGQCNTDEGCGAVTGMGSTGACDTDGWCGPAAGGSGSCHIEDGYCRDWQDADADDYCDLCGYPVCHEAVGASGNTQAQGSSSGTGNYNSGYGCGSNSGHHGGGCHGSSHHR